MEYTIKSKITGETTFSLSDSATEDNPYYVWQVYTDQWGNYKRHQICEGGGHMGNTISATPETFEKVCKKWHRQRLDSIRREEL